MDGDTFIHANYSRYLLFPEEFDPYHDDLSVCDPILTVYPCNVPNRHAAFAAEAHVWLMRHRVERNITPPNKDNIDVYIALFSRLNRGEFNSSETNELINRVAKKQKKHQERRNSKRDKRAKRKRTKHLRLITV